jgi:hypothetical protein
LNILYIASSDPNSLGNILKYYWELLGLGKFTQITKQGPSKKPVDFRLISDGGQRIVGAKYLDRDLSTVEAQMVLGRLYSEADLIHFDRPSEVGLSNMAEKVFYLPPIIKGKVHSWNGLLYGKPTVFGWRGSSLLRRVVARTDDQHNQLFTNTPHALNVYTNVYLKQYLPDDSMFLPLCGNEVVWKRIKRTLHDGFVVSHPSSENKVMPQYLIDNEQKLKHIEDVSDFEHGVDYNQNISVEGAKVQRIIGKSYIQSLQMIADSDVLFHNFRAHGCYGWSAIEGMYFGLPVLNGTSELFRRELGDSPFMETHDLSGLIDNIHSLQDEHTYTEYSQRSKDWYDRYHRPDVVVNKYLIPIYQEAIKRHKGMVNTWTM